MRTRLPGTRLRLRVGMQVVMWARIRTHTHTHTHIHTRMGCWGGCWIGSRRVGWLGAGEVGVWRWVVVGCSRDAPARASTVFSIYLSISNFKNSCTWVLSCNASRARDSRSSHKQGDSGEAARPTGCGIRWQLGMLPTPAGRALA